MNTTIVTHRDLNLSTDRPGNAGRPQAGAGEAVTEHADSYQEQEAGYLDNLGQSTLNGLAKGFLKGMEVGVSFGTNLVPDKYAPLNALSGLIIGVPLGLTFGCVAAPVGAAAGFAMGIVGKNIGKPEGGLADYL